MTATSLSNCISAARSSNLAVVVLTGALVWLACAPQCILAQDAASGRQEEATESDEAVKFVLGEDLQAVVPDLTADIVTYLDKRRTRRVAIEGLNGTQPLVGKVMVRTVAAELKAEGIDNDATATTRLKGKLIERQVGPRRLAVLEWCLQDQSGFELCAMRRRLTITGPLLVEAPDATDEASDATDDVIASRQ